MRALTENVVKHLHRLSYKCTFIPHGEGCDGSKRKRTADMVTESSMIICRSCLFAILFLYDDAQSLSNLLLIFFWCLISIWQRIGIMHYDIYLEFVHLELLITKWKNQTRIRYNLLEGKRKKPFKHLRWFWNTLYMELLPNKWYFPSINLVTPHSRNDITFSIEVVCAWVISNYSYADVRCFNWLSVLYSSSANQIIHFWTNFSFVKSV